MASTRINLDDFPDSAYARELRRAAWDMRFSAALEAEFTATYIERMNLRAKVWFSLSVLLTAMLAVRRMSDVGLRDAVVLVNVFALLPCVGVLSWLSWSSSLKRWSLPTTRILLPIYSILVAAVTARGLARGDNLLAGFTLNVLAVFFFSGLMFQEALATGAIMIVAFAIAGLYFGLATTLLIQVVIATILSVTLCAIVHRDTEKSYRTGFLEVALIGELVARDGLTGLMNRRAFDEHLLRVWQHAQRDRQSIALLMIDIDHFKEFNDGFGHQAGDAALRTVAQAVKEFARRPLDLAARFGGEEFAVIFYDMPITLVQDMAERIRQRVQSLQITRPQSHGADGPITVTIGVGLASPASGRTPQGAVQLADEALYEAKRAGRNRVVVKGAEDYRLLDTGSFKTSRAAQLQS